MPGSHFLQDIVIVTRPGANLPFAQVRQAMASVDPGMPIMLRRLSMSKPGQTLFHLAPSDLADLGVRFSWLPWPIVVSSWQAG